MRITLLGAGHIGQTIARLLSSSGDYDVTVLDRDDVALSRLQALPLVARVADTADPAVLLQALRGQQAVINALPYHLATTAATAAREARCHYFDLTEDVAATQAIQCLADGADTAFMPQCGLAPGFIGIVAHHLAQAFDTLHEVKMRVGALPAFPTNALKYNLTWSVDGLINEYCHPCEAIHDGERIAALPLEGLEHFSLDGDDYEAFNTSGGLGTLCDTLDGRVRNLNYRTVRYRGHRDVMKLLLHDLRLGERRALLKDILESAIPVTMQDVVLVFVTVSGRREGLLMQETFARKLYAGEVNGRLRSAIQLTTASAVCAVLDLLAAGRLPQAGFVRQEDVDFCDFVTNRFGRHFLTDSEEVRCAASGVLAGPAPGM